MRVAHSVDDGIVDHLTGRCDAARHEYDVGRGQFKKCIGDAQQERITLCDDWPDLLADKANVRVGKEREHLPRTYRI